MRLDEFLLARIAEDEAVARAAEPATWEADGNSVQSVETGLQAGWDGLHIPVAHLAMTVGKFQNEARNAEHIARHDPARVLAECQAKRNLLSWHRQYDLDESDNPHGREEQCPTWRLLAAVYADHPDYDQSWSVQ